MQLTTRGPEETLTLGRLLGRLAPPNTCIALDGQLGVGKTHLTRGIAEGAAVSDPTLVSSPTYVLLNIYEGPKPVHHLDAYRIASEEDFAAVGFEELLTAGGLVVVEWAARIRHLLPGDYVRIEIQPGDENETQRYFDITGTGSASDRLVEALLVAWPG